MCYQLPDPRSFPGPLMLRVSKGAGGQGVLSPAPVTAAHAAHAALVPGTEGKLQ